MVDLILSVEALFFIFCAIAIVFLIFKRIKDKKEESFEDREN